MIKKIILGSLFLFTLHTFAQEGTASPYSFYGIGDVKFKGTIENRAMGGLGILADSIHYNIQNSASLASLKLTTFSVASTQNFYTFKTDSQSETAQRTNLDYLTIAFPAGKKWGVSAGIMPYSSVGYKILSTNQTTLETLRFTGKGGINRVFLGAGYALNKKFSVGADLSYNFGKTEANAAVFSNPNLQTGSRLLTTSSLTGVSLNTSAIFKTKLNTYDFVTSASFSPSFNLKSVNTENIGTTLFSSTGEDVIAESQDIAVENSTLKLPTKFSFGSGIGITKKWFVGFESTFQGKSEFGNTSKSNVSYESSTKLSLGGYYIPKYNSFSNYFERVNYRAGFRYEKTGLVLNNNSITDKAFTFGLGLPVGGNLSNVNIGVELGSRGTTNAGLIKENYATISIGLSFNDRWFIKRKYD